MKDQFFTLKTVELNNNCPECYSQEGLLLTFKQGFVENRFYRAISKDLKTSMCCNTCNSEIFPVQWTDDIERVYDYQTRATSPKPSGIKLKTITWVILTSIGISLVALALTLLQVF